MTNQYNRYIPIVPLLLNTKDILKNNKCDKFRLTIYSDFIGYHKSGGYANCPVCKNAITNLQYWLYISPHPGHENDSPIQQERQPLVQDKVQERNARLNDGNNFLSVLYPKNEMMTNIILYIHIHIHIYISN
ncbi:MAG TPA: hypothetical protein VE244_09500 [Nitrososphaeraceae archaeon]|jgi:hypothetical protein|nr:hypothetical protein [Nitrososphaeraceae archaeon]